MKNLAEPRWYVFYCASRAEKKVAALLQKLGYDVFLPVVTTLRQWSDRKKKVVVPLFPGYVFVLVEPSRIAAVSALPGVVGALSLAGRYGYLRQEEVDATRQLIAFGSSILVAPGTIAPGDPVVVDEGPLRGLQGTCISQAGQQYLFVQIEALHQLIRVKIPAGAVRSLGHK